MTLFNFNIIYAIEKHNNAKSTAYSTGMFHKIEHEYDMDTILYSYFVMKTSQKHLTNFAN